MKAFLAALVLAGIASTEAPAAQWQTDPAKSSLAFVLTWAKEPFKAEFKKWAADIDFDPADLAHAKVDVAVDIGSLLSEDPVNDKYRNGPNGLDAAHFRQARFVTKSFRAVGPGKYEATADLTVHGITKEVKLPFALTMTGNTAHMTGDLTATKKP